MSCAPHILPRMALIFLVSFAAQVWAQQKTAPQPVQQPTPHDFSDMVDTTAIHHMQYQGYEKTPLKFSTKVQYVLVPIVVTDKDGNPVSGLKKEDFRLEENGKAQSIASVDEIVPILGTVSKTPLGNANEASNELAIHDKAPRRLIIIAIDMVDTPFFDQSRARQQVISYLSRTIEEDSLYQVVAIENNGIRILHDYTQSSADLIATLKKVSGHFTEMDRIDPGAYENFGGKLEGNFSSGTPGATSVGSGLGYSLDPKSDFQAWADAKLASAEQPHAQLAAANAAAETLRAFQQIAHQASGIPGRKSLIWITGGFPFSIDPVTASLSSGIPFDVYQHVMQELSDQMIAVYPVDARGLLTTNVDSSVQLRYHRAENFHQEYLVADAANRQSDIIETMEIVADMTGGRAFINTNDTAGAVRSAAKDGSRYYLLSYPLDTSNRRQGWRKISVKVGSYHVRARKGYYVTQTTVDPASAARFDVDAALGSPLDYTGVPLRVLLKAPTAAADGKSKVPFFTAIAPSGITVDNADNNHVFIDVSYIALTPQGDRAYQENKSYNLNLSAQQLQQLQTHGFGFDGTVAVAPGAYKLRVVVRDNLNGHVGSVLADLRAN